MISIVLAKRDGTRVVYITPAKLTTDMLDTSEIYKSGTGLANIEVRQPTNMYANMNFG